MNFKEFVAAKRAMALVEHMLTLSEQDAHNLINTLDEQTIQTIETLIETSGLYLQAGSEDGKPVRVHAPTHSGAPRKVLGVGERKGMATRNYETAIARTTALNLRLNRQYQKGAKLKNKMRAHRALMKAARRVEFLIKNPDPRRRHEARQKALQARIAQDYAREAAAQQAAQQPESE